MYTVIAKWKYVGLASLAAYFLVTTVVVTNQKSLIANTGVEPRSENGGKNNVDLIDLTVMSSDGRDAMIPATLRRFRREIPASNCTTESRFLDVRVARCNAPNTSCSLTCRSLLQGNAQSVAAAIKLKQPTTSQDNVTLQLVQETSDCAAYRQSRGFHDAVDPSIADFPLAFNLIVHRDAHQVARLLRAIYRPNNVYCIHVDARSKPDFRAAMSALIACFDNVRLASRLVKVTWAGYSRLQADINCMRDHVDSGRDWKYLINTAGQAFPLKTVEQMVRILRIYNGSNDIEGIYGKRVLRKRFEFEWREMTDSSSMKKTNRRHVKPPHGLNIVRGSAYGAFSRRFVEFALRDQRARDLLEWSRKTYSPDEHFWATLHHAYANPKLKAPGSFNGQPEGKPFTAVYANWVNETSVKCHGLTVRQICVFGAGDLPALLKRRELFANKFYANFQPLALDCLEAWIGHKEHCPLSAAADDNLEYYRKLPFVTKRNKI